MKRILLSVMVLLTIVIGFSSCAVEATTYPDDYYYYGPEVRSYYYYNPGVPYYRYHSYPRYYSAPRHYNYGPRPFAPRHYEGGGHNYGGGHGAWHGRR